MYVAQPWRLRFKVNPSRHTLAASELFNHFPQKEAPLSGSVKSVVADTYDKAKERMVEEVLEYTQQIAETHEGGIQATDFTLIYSINEVKDGLFWGGGGSCSWHDLGK